MNQTPDREAVLQRFDKACETYLRAEGAWQRQDSDLYEHEIRTTAREAVGALELAIRFHLEHDCSRSPPKANFPAMVGLLETARPPVSASIRDRFIRYRTLRNHTEHSASIPSQSRVLEAIWDTRRFLVSNLRAPEEALAIPRPETTATDSREANPVGDHRTMDPERAVSEAIADGVGRLRALRGGRYDATIESLALEARTLLLRAALALCETGPDATSSLGTWERDAEAELNLLLSGLQPDLERVRRLVPLLGRRTSLCLDAGWLAPAGDGVAFADSLLPSLLVGCHISTGAIDAERLRVAVASRRSWSEAAWAATRAGDDPEVWCGYVLGADASEHLLERVVSTCGALGGVSESTPLSQVVIDAVQTCIFGLRLFMPRPTTAPDANWPAAPWSLDVPTWQRCVLDLAHASMVWRDEWARWEADATDRRGIIALERLVQALALSSPTTAKGDTAIRVACAPAAAAARGAIKGPFVEAMFQDLGHGVFGGEFSSQWLSRFGIPALWDADPDQAAELLAVPSPAHFGGFLLNRPELAPEWERAWKHLLAMGARDVALAAWDGLFRFVAGREDEPTRALARRSFGELEAAGFVEEARARLRQWVESGEGVPADDGPQAAAITDFLKWAEFTEIEWAGLATRWTERPALAWRALLQAGAPDTAIAHWCVTQVTAREALPVGLREGPAGTLVPGGMKVLSQGEWRLAFDQALLALDWILAEGSEAAIGIIADACLPAANGAVVVDPPMHRIEAVKLHVSLAQVLWSRVIGRAAGRSAFLSRVEQGKSVGHSHWLGTETDIPIVWAENSVWLRVVQPLLEAGVEQGDMRAFAARVFACFELRLKQWPPIGSLNGEANHELILATSAQCGVDVSEPLRGRLIAVASLPTQSRGERPFFLAVAMRHLAEHHPAAAAPILHEALAPAVLDLMRTDETEAFWSTMLRHHGREVVLAVVDGLGPVDLGLGFFDALATIDRAELRRRHLRPGLLRAALVRSVEGKFRPDAGFWPAVWESARSAVFLPELPGLRDGDWLTELLERSRDWPPESAVRLLRRLATTGADPIVRRRCTDALLAMLS